MSSPGGASRALRPTRLFWAWTWGSVLLAILVRLRYLNQPLAPDEGGYLALSRAWSGGGDLYTRFWVDRPQGMMTLMVVGDQFTAFGDGYLRLLAVVLGIVGIVGVAWMAYAISERWQAGAVAAVFVSVVTCSPAIEGFTANGELLAAAFSVPGMAVTIAVMTDRLPLRWMILAGALAGLALSVKQSGYDGLIGTALWMALAWWFRWRPRAELVAVGALVLVGLGAVLGAVFLHGTGFGWSDYWYAIVGFRIGSRSVVSSPQWGRLGITAAITLSLVVGMGALALWHRIRSGRSWREQVRPAEVLVLCWLVGGGLALLTGGNYHRHYWITVAFPLALLLALAVTREGSEPVGGVSPAWLPLPARELALGVVVPLAVTSVFLANPRLEQDDRLHQDRAIAAWVHSHTGGTNGILLPVCGSATYHAAAGQTPPYPYLWVDNIVAAEDAIPRMVDLLGDPDGPAFVARFQPTADCDPSGAVDAAIAEHFEPVATIEGVEVLLRRGSLVAEGP